jgi:hypothetical protein
MNSGPDYQRGLLDSALQSCPNGSIMSDDELEVAGLPPLLAFVYIML